MEDPGHEAVMFSQAYEAWEKRTRANLKLAVVECQVCRTRSSMDMTEPQTMNCDVCGGEGTLKVIGQQNN